ncbi:MAG: amino acid adenylation domain-containing protein [Proteobacteria bacterium]|nr:amino acid adenylation domain-containing protein [Pseudomonadota bacterium]
MGPVETQLAAVWQELLQIERVGREDNFFELGGHSLLAVALVERMAGSGLYAEPRQVFAAPTLRGLAQELRTTSTVAAVVPPNLIGAQCDAIAPAMLPLVDLSQREIDHIVATVPGGARAIQDIYPLAPLQEGIFFHHLLSGDRDPYLSTLVLQFDAKSDMQQYWRALGQVVQRHDALRTAVVHEHLREPVQVVWRSAEPVLDEVILEADAVDPVQRLRSLATQRHPNMPLDRAPLLRGIAAANPVDKSWYLLLLSHHLTSDHSTLETINAEIAALRANPDAELPAPVPFRRLVVHALDPAARASHAAFFQAMLADIDEPTAAYGLLDVRGDGIGNVAHSERLDAQLLERLRGVSRQLQVSSASVLHLAFAALLARLAGKLDVVFGTVVLGRLSGADSAGKIVGPSINTLPLRVALRDQSVTSGLRAMYRSLTDLMGHEQASLALAQRCSSIPAPAPLFTALLNYRHNVRGAASAAPPGVRICLAEERTNYPLAVVVDDDEASLGITIDANAALDARSLWRMLRHTLVQLIGALESQPELAIEQLEVLSSEEQEQALRYARGAITPAADELTLHELFEQRATQAGGSVALLQGERTVSYAELDRRATELAGRLIALGVGLEDRVALTGQRSIELVVAMLATLKAGAAYVPLDPQYPAERLAWMLSDAAPKVLLKSADQATPWAETRPQMTVLELSAADAVDESAKSTVTLPTVRADALAYMIYTSGSSGTPKGVLVEHRNAVNLVRAMQPVLQLTSADRMLHHSSISFDASIWELFVPLASGAGVIVAAPTAQGDPAEMLRTIERDAATVMLFVPAFLQAMLDHSEMRAQPSVRLVAAGGEALLATRARQLRSQWPQAQILNLYGPTESAVVATVYDTTHLPADAVAVPIGRPIANSTAYILDDRLRPVPVGVVGEICLGGASVVRGYHNRAALSRERFSSDPFAAAANARLYRTGDLGRYLPDGNIEFLGRTDTQVKLRGFRVELGEIEAQLAAQVGMRDACVTLHRGVGGADTLVAYLVGDDINIATLREALARSLPRHMIPTAFVELDALPLLPNGKVNRQQLPEPQQNAYVRTEFSAAETATERQLAAIWCEVLQLERVGREDNFFELGGHSLLATQVASRVRVQFGLDVPLRRLFEQPSLAAFAAQIDLAQRSSERVPSRAIEPLPRDAPLPVSFSQRRMWFMQQLEPQGTAYNIPAAVRLRGPLEPGILRRAMDDLAARHEAFRTSFSIVAGEPVQIIALQHRGRIEPIDLTDLDLAAAEAEAARLCRAESLRPFDLQTGPLWRIHLIKLRADDTVLLWSMHHVISDQWSMGVLARDLAFFYNQRAHRELGTHTGNAEVESLPPLRIQYADFAVWQRQHWNDTNLEVQLDFWRQRLRGLEPLELPTDRPRTAMPTSRGGAVNAKLSAATLEGINRLSVQLGVTPFMTLLACFKLLLARYSGQEDIAVGVPIANRHRLETETLVGTLVNMVVMRTDLSGDASFAAIVGRVRETALEAYTHQDTSFERLVEELVDKRVTSRAPLVQVMFNVPNAPLTMPSLQGLTTEPFRFESGSAQFELSLTVDTELTQIVSLAYATDLFVAQTAERMLAGYLRLLDQVIGDPQRRITELELLSAAERAQLIAEGSRSGDDYPERRVDQLVARQSARTPDAIAVRMGEQRLTYAELQRQVDALAGHLTKRGIGRSALVGVHLERSPAMLVALLAIMRSGAAYVPLDPGFPRDRLEFMVADAGVALVLSERLLRKSRPANWPLVELESIAHEERTAGLPAAVATLDDLAYVLYTSGSTGQPKGIEIEHRALTNFLHSMQAQPGCGQNDVLLAVTTLSFDISGLELYLPLTVGGQVVIASRAEAADGNLLRKAIAKYHPTVMQATPATWRMLLASGWAGEPQLRVLCGGEALPADLARSLLTRCASLWNLYGPTETTIWSTAARIEKVADVVPIGKPIANTSVHVLDRNMRPVPPGVAGELYIGGEGVARGYRNRTDLTRERFISNPFAADAAARLYRTGDRARRLPSGELQHLGRLDFQVKVRGFRVELGEIETVLAQHPSLQQVVVAAKADSDGVAQRLVGYAVAAPGAPPTPQELRAFLHGKLPDYMVPSQFMLLDKLPLTANNKVDIRALPEPAIERRPRRDAALEEPSDMLQLQLLALWRQVLNDPELGIEDNFFDAGGHSLKAVELLTLVEQVFHKQLPLAMFFEAPTVAKMALLVRASGWSPSWRSLVAIQPRGLKLPLFAVPGAGGNVLVFAALAKLLGKERPLYGLQSRGLDGLSKPFKTIEDAAEHFLTEMRSVQPAGPYFILGTCTGGVVGFEMAQRLRRAGEQVTLAIIETWHPSSNRRSVLGVDRFWRLRQWQERLRLFFTVLREVPVTRWPAFIVGKLASVLRGDPAQPDTETARSDRVRDATMQAVAHYQASLAAMGIWTLLRFLLDKSRQSVVWMMIAGLLSGLFSAAFLALISRALQQTGQWAGWLLLAFVAAAVGKIVAGVAAQLLLVRISQATILQLSLEICRRLLRAPLRTVERRGGSQVLATLTDDVTSVTWAMQCLPQLAMHLSVLAGCAAYLAWLSWRVFMAMLLVTVVSAAIYRWLYMRALQQVERSRLARGSLLDLFRHLTFGIKELMMHGRRRSAFVAEALQPAADEYRKSNVVASTQYAIADAWIQFLYYLLIGLLLFAMPVWLPGDAEALTAYVFAMLYLMNPIYGIVGAFPPVARGEVALRRIEELGLKLDEEIPTDEPSPAAASPGQLREDTVSLRDVVFAYDAQTPAESGFKLGPINFDLRPGELVFVVGGNGSGKSTFIKLLAGLYPPLAVSCVSAMN